MSRVKNLHDLFIVTVGIRLRVDDIYSFNNIYAPTPFECINRHFAKMGYMSLMDFCISGLGQAFVCVLPNSLRKSFYMKFLRK